jgi:NADH dehydrogenase
MVRSVLLLTGATGRVGSALLPSLLARPEPVRCLVRDPRRLGADRVRVQLVLGDLADPASFRHALRGVTTVVHLAASWRDQPRARLEALDGDAAARLAEDAVKAGVERFVLLSPLGAAPQHPLRAFRAKAAAEAAVLATAMQTTVLRASVIHGPGDRVAPLLAGRGDAPVQPIAAADVAACVLAALERPGVHELAGPQTVRWRTYARLLRGTRPLRVPPALLRPALRGYATVAGPAAALTWDEAERATAPMTAAAGTAGAEALGVTPRPLTAR